ncbi:MAG TPA: ThuA domain-containing protein [Pirellulales bacterium]|jgi:type 1 glutamine amidotransferase|nr:ThuA domain-containing protein [Pirellulales bacterium]
MNFHGCRACIVVCFLLVTWPAKAAEPALELPAGITVEQPCPDPALKKIVFIAGSNFFKAGQHDYVGGSAVLIGMVRQTSGAFPLLALDWPQKPETLAEAKAVVFYFDGGDKHALLDADKLQQVRQLADAGAGIVSLHQGADIPKSSGETLRALLGAAFEKDYSRRAHWTAEFKTFPDHPICRGVEPFEIDDGWLYRLRFVDQMRGIAPLLRTTSPKPNSGQESEQDTIVSWAFKRPGGGRSFTFTGAHLHESLGQEGYRRFLTNGILWTAGFEIPSNGAPVELAANRLDAYLTPPPASAAATK